MRRLEVKTRERTQFVDITAQVREVVSDENIVSGLCVVFCPHTTAGLTINENADPSVCRDILAHLEGLVPQSRKFTHSEGNSDAHIKASMMGSSLNVIIENKKLVLGTWQGIYFCEFDGPRQRKIYLKIIKD